ncbi:Uncharacterised protein [uncultured archaeon]|nr:Uncharacterised protein [uncultured archaeon]
MAQWIDDEFALQVSEWIRELALTGQVRLGYKKTRAELERLQKENRQLQTKHRQLLEKKTYHKFKKGASFYIISDLDGKSLKCKVGFEGLDISVRLQQHRSTMPHCKLEYLVYCEDALLLETIMLNKLYNNRKNFNHEWIYAMTPEQVIKEVRATLHFMSWEYSEDTTIQNYNNQIEADFQIVCTLP